MAILGVLFAALVAVLAPAKQIAKLHDSKRQQDIKQIQTALDTYYNDKNCYPLTLDQLTKDPVYIKKIPVDPENVNYRYVTDNTTDCPQWEALFSKNEVRALQDSQSNNPSTATADDCPLVNYSNCSPVNFDQLYNHCDVAGNIDNNACSVLDAATLPLDSQAPAVQLVPGGCYCSDAGTPSGPAYDIRAGNCNVVNNAPYNYCDANCSIPCQ